jgi:DNA-binding NtrC family response regulator
MLEMLARISRCGPALVPVLLRTENGTDIHEVARAIHDQSPRKHESFAHLHVSGCGPDRQEHDLFGYEKGSFDGALARRVGLWEVCRKGTLFLQDVDDLTLPMQAKLLNAMRLGTFRRVGGWDPVASPTRLVASASTDLMEQVGKGLFREDLFYALSVYELEIPPLRVRGTDVISLARQRLIQLADERGMAIPRLSADVLTVLQSYPWPGNHQELDAAMMRALVETGSTGMIFTEHLPERMTRVGTATDLGQITTGQLTQLMDRHSWNLQAVATDLDMSMDELHGLLRRQGPLGGRTG